MPFKNGDLSQARRRPDSSKTPGKGDAGSADGEQAERGWLGDYEGEAGCIDDMVLIYERGAARGKVYAIEAAVRGGDVEDICHRVEFHPEERPLKDRRHDPSRDS